MSRFKQRFSNFVRNSLNELKPRLNNFRPLLKILKKQSKNPRPEPKKIRAPPNSLYLSPEVHFKFYVRKNLLTSNIYRSINKITPQPQSQANRMFKLPGPGLKPAQWAANFFKRVNHINKQTGPAGSRPGTKPAGKLIPPHGGPQERGMPCL